MKTFSLLSLLLCLVALSQAQEILPSGGTFTGCFKLGSIDGWTGGYGSYPPPAFFLTNPPPPQYTCYACVASNSRPGEDKMSQMITIEQAGKYDFTGAVACVALNAGTCSYFLKIGDNDIPLTPNTDPSPGFTGNDLINLESRGIDLPTGTFTFEFRLAFSDGSTFAQAFIPFFSLKPSAGSGSADPHMVGFHGQRFDYFGQAGQVVNMISDPALQMNVKLGLQKQSANMFFDGPVMMEMIFITRSHTISINAGGYLKEETGFVKVDGVLLPIGQSLSFPDGKISVSFSVLSALAKDLGLVGDEDHIVAQVKIKLEGLFEFTVFMIENGRDPNNPDRWFTKYPRRFLDFNASLLDPDRRPHGILGQTAAPLSKGRSVGEWKIEGTDQDYVVKDGLTGTQFAFNKF